MARTSKSTCNCYWTTLNRVLSMSIKNKVNKIVQRTKLVCPRIANSLLNAMLMTYIIHKVINTNKTFKISNFLNSHSINSKACVVISLLKQIMRLSIRKDFKTRNIKNNLFRQPRRSSKRPWTSWRWLSSFYRIWGLIPQTLARCCRILHRQRARTLWTRNKLRKT